MGNDLYVYKVEPDHFVQLAASLFNILPDGKSGVGFGRNISSNLRKMVEVIKKGHLSRIISKQ